MMWAKSLSIPIEVNVSDRCTDLSLELTTTGAMCTVTLTQQSRTLT